MRDDSSTHRCDSRVIGEEVVFTCPLCPGYERRLNRMTRKMSVRGLSATVQHMGSNGLIVASPTATVASESRFDA